jgi:hypothetical protein
MVQRIRDHQAHIRVFDDRTIGISGDAVCGLHRIHGDEDIMFLG